MEDPTHKNKIHSQKPPLVFIHGIKGAELRDKTSNHVHWLTIFQALNFSSPQLQLPLEWENGVQKKDTLIAGSILRKVGPSSVYSNWLHAAAEYRTNFFEFAYDWRRDLNETSEKFEDYLKSLKEKYESKIQVVAHSMGGLITFSVIQRNPELFQSVVFAGVPFGQGIGFLKDIHVGESVGLNHKILGPDVLFSCPSIFTFFPPSSLQRVVDTEKKEIFMDFFDVNCWEEHQLSIFGTQYQNLFIYYSIFSTKNHGNHSINEWKTHLKNCLEKAKIFRDEIIFSDKVEYPPIATLVSKIHATTRFIMKGGPKSSFGLDFETMPKVEGDGRVVYEGSQPPKGVLYKEYFTTKDHGALLDDKIIFQILDTLLSKTNN